jgi:hypothetical protein
MPEGLKEIQDYTTITVYINGKQPSNIAIADEPLNKIEFREWVFNWVKTQYPYTSPLLRISGYEAVITTEMGKSILRCE